MSDYRDDLGAAQARIAQLEEELAARKEREREVAAPDPLAALAEKGDENRRAVAKRAAASDAGLSYHQRCATSALGFMCGWGAWFVFGMPALFGVLMAQGAMRAKLAGPSLWFVSEISLAIAAVLGAGMIAGRLAVRASVPRELAWVDSLPFAIQGHFALFDYGDNGRFTVHFTGAAPEQAAFEKWVAGVSVPYGGELDVRGFRVRMRSRGLTAHAQWRFWRTIVRELLLPLHARFPIARVTYGA